MKRIKKARLKQGLTLKDIAKLMGKNESTIQRYESGSVMNMKYSVICDYAKILGTSPAFLLGLSEDSSNTINIPIVGAISCGDPILAEENTVGHITESIVNIPSGELFYLKTKGKSMEPTIPEDSYVLVRKQSTVENGEIAAILMLSDEPEATLKRVKRQDDLIILSPDNPNYNPIVVTENHRASIIGKAMSVRFEL